MTPLGILTLTVLAVVLVLALALLAGSLALLVGGGTAVDQERGGLVTALQLLDRQWQLERLVYRHHRLFGAVVLITGAVSAWKLWRSDLSALLEGSLPVATMAWSLLIGQGFNFLVGLVILLRPSLLKPVETIGNRWHRLDSAEQRGPRTLRTTAVVLSLVGLLVMLGTAALIFEQIGRWLP
jgi:hypothetical protein